MDKVVFVKKPGELCPYCQKGRFVVRTGKYSDFLGCSRFPACGGRAKITDGEADRRKALEREADRLLGLRK